jgi:hypothetical protein
LFTIESPSNVPVDWCPLLVLVNSASGGGDGALFAAHARRVLNAVQVVDMCDNDARKARAA